LVLQKQVSISEYLFAVKLSLYFAVQRISD
jgi:hypothetical protein